LLRGEKTQDAVALDLDIAMEGSGYKTSTTIDYLATLDKWMPLGFPTAYGIEWKQMIVLDWWPNLSMTF
jgi:hypothetical protein